MVHLEKKSIKKNISLYVISSDPVNHHVKNCVNSNKSNAMHCGVRMAFQRHTMKLVANVVNAKIHAEIIHVQKIPSVLSISHNMIHHLHLFVEDV